MSGLQASESPKIDEKLQVSEHIRRLPFRLRRCAALITALALLAAGCAAPDAIPDAVPPWQLRTITAALPQESPTLWVDRAGAWLAWPGDPLMPNIRLLDARQPGEPVLLPLGIRPERVALYPLAEGWLQLLWIDQRLPGQRQLVGGTLGPDRDVRRGPTEIARGPVVEFSAVSTPGGDLNVFWVEAQEQDAATPLFAALIDGVGRPRLAVRLADSGRYPAGAYDGSGALHLAWLEPGPAGNLWTVRYLAFPGGHVAAVEEPGTPVGVIQLEADQALESFTLGLDATHVYCLWGMLSLGTGVQGSAAGLTFPIGQMQNSRSLSLAVADPLHEASSDLGLRWPVVAAGQAAADSLFVAFSADSGGAAFPLVVRLTPDGADSAWPVASGEGPPGRVAFAAHDGTLHLAWAVLRPDGSAAIHHATGALPLTR